MWLSGYNILFRNSNLKNLYFVNFSRKFCPTYTPTEDLNSNNNKISLYENATEYQL